MCILYKLYPITGIYTAAPNVRSRQQMTTLTLLSLKMLSDIGIVIGINQPIKLSDTLPQPQPYKPKTQVYKFSYSNKKCLKKRISTEVYFLQNIITMDYCLLILKSSLLDL